MAYQKTNWKNTVYDDEGNILQKGTPLVASIMEKIEQGIVDIETKVDGIESDWKELSPSKANATTDGLLSKEDYTKLAGIEAGAQKNAVLSVNGQTGAVTTPDTKYTAGTNVTISGNTISATNTTYGLASASNHGLISRVMWIKLNELNYTRTMTQAQYDSLSQAEKDRTDVWYGIYKE